MFFHDIAHQRQVSSLPLLLVIKGWPTEKFYSGVGTLRIVVIHRAFSRSPARFDNRFKPNRKPGGLVAQIPSALAGDVEQTYLHPWKA